MRNAVVSFISSCTEWCTVQNESVETDCKCRETQKLEKVRGREQGARRLEEEKHDVTRRAMRVVLKVYFDVWVLRLDGVYELHVHEVVVYEHERAVVADVDASAVALDTKRFLQTLSALVHGALHLRSALVF
jgi:hypothetical protein